MKLLQNLYNCPDTPPDNSVGGDGDDPIIMDDEKKSKEGE